MICLYVNKYPTEWPQVAEILDCSEDNSLTVRWYRASYTGYCHKFSLKKNKKVDWVEKVQKEDIIFRPFDLLPSSKLPKQVVDFLKEEEANFFF